jgi:hypothetical protein
MWLNHLVMQRTTLIQKNLLFSLPVLLSLIAFFHALLVRRLLFFGVGCVVPFLTKAFGAKWHEKYNRSASLATEVVKLESWYV